MSNNYQNNKGIIISGDNTNECKGNKNTIDQSVNKHTENKTFVNISYPKRETKKEKEQREKCTQRPALKDNVGKRITCFGLTVCKYPYSDFYTVVNVVDKNGNYIADHIQLDYKENIYNYSGQIPLKDNYIRFTGIVKPYPKGRGDDYCIEIIDKVDMTSSRIYYTGEIINYEEVEIDYNKIGNYLKISNMTKLYDIIDGLREEINVITEDVLTKDFIYYYIINQYFLNRATYSIYEGELRDQGFNEDCVLDLMILLGSTLFDLKSFDSIDLYELFERICYSCNILQGVKKLIVFRSNECYDATYEHNPDFEDFCRNKLNCKGERKLRGLWYTVLLRKKDFGMMRPYPDKLDKQILTYRSYHMITKYIPR